MLRVGACDFEQTIVQHHDAQRPECDSWGDLDFIHVVDFESSGLLNPILQEWIAQGMVGFGFR
jgi:hypothetical protein